MPKSSRAAGRSFFSNLPLELRTSLRSQVLVPLVPGANINDFQLKSTANGHDDHNGNAVGERELLPTQPASPSSPSSTMDGNTSSLNLTAGYIGDTDTMEDMTSTITPVAESSTAGQKRAAQIKMLVSPSNAKRRRAPSNVNGDGKSRGKGKGKGRAVVDVMKRYKGHAWDCTSVVPRYTDSSELPPNLVKCVSCCSLLPSDEPFMFHERLLGGVMLTWR